MTTNAASDVHSSRDLRHLLDAQRVSRRQLFAGAGVLGVGALLAAAPQKASAATGTATTESANAGDLAFRSRPDLHPPAITVTTTGPPADGYAFVTPSGPMIVDALGNPVWIHEVPHAAMNLRVQRYRGEPVLTWWQGTVTKWGTGSGVGKIAGSDYRTIATVECGNGLSADLHEFLLTDRGTAYMTAVDSVRADLREVGGPKDGTLGRSFIQEVDVASGEVLFEWDSSKHIPLSESKSKWDKVVNGTKPFSAVHLNSINVMDDGNLLVSARNTWALYKIDPTTGTILWRLGGKSSDFTLGAGVRFAWQHDAKQHPDGTISLFDDEATPTVRERSRALFLGIDEQSMHARVLREYTHKHPRLLAGSQGSTQVLPNGDVFVGWGSEPYYTRFAPGGETLLDAKYETGTSYRAFHSAWEGQPSDPPAIAVEKGRNGLTVHASWNGATQVAHWQALGGASATTLQVVGSAPRKGFETAIPVHGAPAWLSAQALDGGGKVLATAKVTQAP